MSFRMRLFITYFLLIVLLIVGLGVFFYRYTSGIFEDNAYSNLEVITNNMSEQLDKLIQPMDLITTFLLSTDKFMSSMTSLAVLDRTKTQNKPYISDAKNIIQSNVLTYATHKHFYRVSFFNTNGDFVTSHFNIENVNSNIENIINKMDWIPEIEKARGRAVIIPPYEDPWALSDSEIVFGLARCIQGPKGGMGYIEVQNLYADLENIFSVPVDSNITVLAATSDGKIFFGNDNLSDSLKDYYLSMDITKSATVSEVDNPINMRQEIIACTESDYSGIRLVLVQDKKELLRPFIYTSTITIAIGLLILMVSTGYIYLFSKQLAKPIRELKEKMEGIEYENLPEKISINSSNNEIKALNQSFQRLRDRINDAVSREIKSRTLQMQANFDSLQAQVNPHFLYNILNVLSHKGMLNGDEEICEICDSIASMLRYSTSTLESSSTIYYEMEHVRNYLSLMKKRFEHRLEFFFDIDPSIYNEVVPKIVFQQVVENSLDHGYKNNNIIMEIDIKGYTREGWWYIQITDNGDGFDREILQELGNKIMEMDKEIRRNERISGLAIGGMGLINTYARMALFYKHKFLFQLRNNDNGRGAQVVIGSHLSKEKENSGQ